MSSIQLRPDCAEACRILTPLGRHAGGCVHFTHPYGKGWCGECRRMVQIEDKHDESYYSGTTEVGYIVEVLACGHERQFDQGIIGTSPGGESIREALDERALRRRQEGWDPQ